MEEYTGPDHFTFTASDGLGGSPGESRPAEVSIMVVPWSGDVTRPQVTWTQPEAGAVLAEVGTSPIMTDTNSAWYEPIIKVRFSEAVDSSTISADTVRISDSSGHAILATVAYDGLFNEVVVTPQEPPAMTRYTVVVDGSVRDLIGNTLGTDYAWSFSIGAAGSKLYLPSILKRPAAPPPTATATRTPTRRPIPTATPTATPQDGWQTIFLDDFEGSFPGPWQLWGDPTWDRTDCLAGAQSLSFNGQYSVWPAAAGMGSVIPCVDNYPNELNSWLFYGPFDLTDATAAEVSFRFWARTEEDYDHFSWLASTDDQTYYGWEFSGDSGGWMARTIDLSDVSGLGDLRGQPQVWVAFVMESDGSIGYEGAFVDDVVIHKRTTVGATGSSPGRGQLPDTLNPRATVRHRRP
jgi:hypothetical protein